MRARIRIPKVEGQDLDWTFFGGGTGSSRAASEVHTAQGGRQGARGQSRVKQGKVRCGG
jgi:hypothetical protein